MHFSISIQIQHFHAGHERAVNDSKLAFPDFWMVANLSLCGRSRFREGVPQARWAAKRPGVMRAIKGNIGAERAEKWNSFAKMAVKPKDGVRTSLNPLNAEAVGFSRRRGAEEKKMLVVPACGEGSHLLREPVHLTASDSYNLEDEFPCN